MTQTVVQPDRLYRQTQTIAGIGFQPVPRIRYEALDMTAETPPAKKKAADVNVLRCLDPNCGGLLAYEVDSDNNLYVDLSWTARRDGETRYFPCPKCGGRNVLEESRDAKGRSVQRVSRFEPAR